MIAIKEQEMNQQKARLTNGKTVPFDYAADDLTNRNYDATSRSMRYLGAGYLLDDSGNKIPGLKMAGIWIK